MSHILLVKFYRELLLIISPPTNFLPSTWRIFFIHIVYISFISQNMYLLTLEIFREFNRKPVCEFIASRDTCIWNREDGVNVRISWLFGDPLQFFFFFFMSVTSSDISRYLVFSFSRSLCWLDFCIDEILSTIYREGLTRHETWVPNSV